MKTLYKKTATGAMSQWSIVGSLEKSRIEIWYGQVGGALQIQHHHVEVNKSGRSLKEQLLLEIKSRISKQRAKGYRNTQKEASQFAGLNELNALQPMLAQRHDKVNISGMPKWFRQFKYDGHRMLVQNTGEELIAYSRNGKVIDTLGHILDSLDIPEGMTLDGEVYHHGTPLQTIASWCKRKQDNTIKLVYHVYDIPSSDLPYEERLKLLQNINLGMHAKLIPTWLSDHSVTKDLDEARDMGYEGLILRNPAGKYECGKRSKHLIKVKKALDDEFQVVKIHESSDGWAVLECVTLKGHHFRVSAPGTIEEKRLTLQLQDNYIGEWIRVEFFSETNDGVPFHPVAIEWRNKALE